MTLRRKFLYSLIPSAILYLFAEIVTTVYYLRGDLEPVSIWVLEDAPKGQTIRFDPILGYKLTPTPSRIACIATNGVVESVGAVCGNNHGFPDRDEFWAKRSKPDVRRFAVFGDSFSAAPFLQTKWPDRCEDLSAEAGRSIELLNMSIDAGGHTNWWKTLREFVEPRGYELDGVIFAVYGNDLRRPFVIWDDQVIQHDDQGNRTIALGTVWNQKLPRSLAEARPFFHGLPRWQVHTSETFDAMLQGTVRPADDRNGPYLLHCLYRFIFDRKGPRRQYTMQDVIDYHNNVDPTRVEMWREIREYLETNKVPALVVDVPSIDLMLIDAGPSLETQAFARFIRAKYVDGAQAFSGLSKEQIRKCWLPYDGHWDQTGSDRFAKFMSEELANWP